jgi:hypothetical protein
MDMNMWVAMTVDTGDKEEPSSPNIQNALRFHQRRFHPYQMGTVVFGLRDTSTPTVYWIACLKPLRNLLSEEKAIKLLAIWPFMITVFSMEDVFRILPRDCMLVTLYYNRQLHPIASSSGERKPKTSTMTVAIGTCLVLPSKILGVATCVLERIGPFLISDVARNRGGHLL